MNNNIIKTCCLIITECSNIDKEKYRNYLKSRLKSLILDDYHYFIAYDEPFFDFTVIQILDDLRKKLGCQVNIEYVIVNCNSKRNANKARKAQYEAIKPFINDITYINRKHDPQNIYRLCEYLADKSNFLFCIETAFKLKNGHTNHRIFKMFKSYDRAIEVIDPLAEFKQKITKDGDFVKCELDYCIYNEACSCLLDKIEINSSGYCEECILVSFPIEKLTEYKVKQLQEIMGRHGYTE